MRCASLSAAPDPFDVQKASDERLTFLIGAAMTDPKQTKLRKWLYPVIYVVFVVLSMLPLYAEKPYSPQDTQDVIINLMMRAGAPYAALAPVLHVATLLLAALVFFRPAKTGRLVAGYMGLNYLIIVVTEAMGQTAKYGFVVHTGGLAADVILGVTWLVVAIQNGLTPSFRRLAIPEYGLLLLAVLAFWAPYTMVGTSIQPRFDPLLLLTSPDYGMTFCLTTPVFLFALILFYPSVNSFAYRITAFNGLLYGLFNLTHWFSADRRWMGFLHLPLLILSLYALILPRIAKAPRAR
jgi:hypothetical protein